MKKIFLLLSFSMLCMISFAQQFDDKREFEIPGISTAEVIKGFADSMHFSYPYYEIGWIGMDNTSNRVSYEINNKYKRIEVRLPIVRDEATARSIFNVVDSLAQTDIYSNKRIANRTFHALARLGGKGDWQTEIAIKAVEHDMNYSAKVTEWPALMSLPESVFNQDIINLIAQIFNDPYITREEAEIIVKGRPAYTPADTTGYAKLQEKYMARTATADEKERYYNLDSQVRVFQARGQTSRQYADSLNRIRYEPDVDRLTGTLWSGCFDIIYYAGNKRIYSLAPLIESFATPAIRKQREDIELILAQLNYKDYYRQQDEKYAHTLDSCIVLLRNNPEFGNMEVRETVMKMTRCYADMTSLGVSDMEILDRLMPIVTIEKPTIGAKFLLGYTEDPQFSIGAYFLSYYIMGIVTNIPVPEDMEIWDWDKNDIPAKMYKWLLENKKNYEWRERPKEE